MSENEFFTKLYTYQKERFPIIVLTLTTFSGILSSYAIVLSRASAARVMLIFFSVMAYLFHMRFIDEYRDYDHDSRYHGERPIQSGMITLRELQRLDIASQAFFMAAAFWLGGKAIIFGVLALAYTFFAKHDFFLREVLWKKFFVYNMINMVQLFLLQFFIYFSLVRNIFFTRNIFFHLAFVFFLVVLIEVSRKVKLPNEESRGLDTYSWHLGFIPSLFFAAFIGVLAYGMFIFLTGHIEISAALPALFLFSTVLHMNMRNKTGESMFLVSTLALYVGLNFLLYWNIVMNYASR